MRSSRLSCIPVLWALVLVSHCARLSVGPLPDPVLAPLPPDAPALEVVFVGETIHSESFARAITISRFFANRLENETGSLADLLGPGVEALASRRGYRASQLPDSSAPSPVDSEHSRLEIRASTLELTWTPPQVFIQTPQARERGVVELRLNLRATFSGQEQPLLDFERAVQARVPEERFTDVMDAMLEDALIAFLIELENRIPIPGGGRGQ